MSPEKTALLYKRYPAIFAQRHRSTRERLMGLGFSCRDGWFDLIDELCATLQAGVDRGDFPQAKAVQVKEKYAGLRFYLNHDADEAAQQIAMDVRPRSLTICEVCGAPGALRELNDWYRTRCELHADPGSTIVPDEP